MAVRLRCNCSCCTCCTLKPETNLAIVLCLVFYLYVCIGGALFLLLEGQNEIRPSQIDNITHTRFGIQEKTFTEIRNLIYEEQVQYRRKLPVTTDNLWNFLEATDFAYRVLTGQGTGQTTRILLSNNSKIAYIFFITLGIPITILTFRATGKRINIIVYSLIRFIDVTLFKRQLTSHVHIKAMIVNFSTFICIYNVGVVMYMATQSWSYLEAAYYTINSLLTVGNFDLFINEGIKTNTDKDKAYRALFNFYSFVAFTIISSFAWSAHLFTRHMRFKAQNNQSARTNGDAGGRRCPWVEVTRSRNSSPTKSICRERDTDRESVC